MLYAIQEASDALDERLAPLVMEAGLTLPQFRLLWYVVEQGPMRLSELARHRRCVKSNISNLVRAMEREDLIEVGPAPDDGRARLVRPTRRGRATYTAAAQEARRVEEALRTQLGGREARRLERLSLSAAKRLDEM
ncbi:MAG: MarR family transcriptional regulator [Myxococcota bacterium]